MTPTPSIPDVLMTFDRFWMDFGDLSYENDDILRGFWEVLARTIQKAPEGLQTRGVIPGKDTSHPARGGPDCSELFRTSQKPLQKVDILMIRSWISGSGSSDLDLRAQKEDLGDILDIPWNRLWRNPEIWTPDKGAIDLEELRTSQKWWKWWYFDDIWKVFERFWPGILRRPPERKLIPWTWGTYPGHRLRTLQKGYPGASKNLSNIMKIIKISRNIIKFY